MPKIILTAQNIDIYEGDGLDPFARTGAASAEQVYYAGAEGVILGHSEVGDSPEVIRQKLLTIVKKSTEHDSKFLNNITVLVGETWEEFQGNPANVVAKKVSDHAVSILKDIPENYLLDLVIGYEPKWGSRGSGHDDAPPPDPKLISTVCKKLRAALTVSFGGKGGANILIIYGGRSTPERTEQILADENVEGLILGSACSSVKKTMDIAQVMARIRPDKPKILHANFKAYNLTDGYETYLKELNTLDDSFIIYLSPCHADLWQVHKLLS